MTMLSAMEERIVHCRRFSSCGALAAPPAAPPVADHANFGGVGWLCGGGVGGCDAGGGRGRGRGRSRGRSHSLFYQATWRRAISESSTIGLLTTGTAPCGDGGDRTVEPLAAVDISH